MTRAQDEREVVATAIVNQVRADHGMSPCALANVDDPSPYLRQADAILALRSQDEYRRGVEDSYEAVMAYVRECNREGRVTLFSAAALRIRALATSDDSAGEVPALTKADDSGRQV